MSLANISLVGNLVRAPERIEFSSGRVKTTLVVAVNNFVRASGKSDKATSADFYKVETWGKLAELAAKCLYKGNQITVTGRLIMDHWTDKHGSNRITPVVEASQLSLPPKKTTDKSSDKHEMNDDTGNDNTHNMQPAECEEVFGEIQEIDI
jgi:single stranded DNA-binding protein (ssb)